MSESPCLKCNRKRPCDPAKINKLSRTNACGPYARYLGQQEGYAAGEKAIREQLVGMVVGGEMDALRAEVEVLRSLVVELTDAGECWYDHHGYCQAHSLQEKPCPHSRAKELLRAISEARKGE